MRTSSAETDTIAAVATPLGEGGLAVLRLSGPAALTIAEKVFTPAGRDAVRPSVAASHTLHYGRIHQGDRILDEVLLAVMRAPRTFTREDVVEISCHGGVFVARQILEALLAAGARLASPGEFTRRAFLNGRIDLVQAEAVADLIHARTELALGAANEQLAGTLSRQLDSVREDLLALLAHVEAHIDFPDEDIAPHTRDQMLARLRAGVARMDALLATAREGRVLRRGIRAVILGRPNVGKSSLLNRLLGHDRAIVSPVAGTTRDTIEETANVRGIPIVFIDTAGLRPAEDVIEREGIRRTQAAAEAAELVLHVLDWTQPLEEQDHRDLAWSATKPRVLVLNKADRPGQAWAKDHSMGPPSVEVSCTTGAGLEALKDAISALVWQGRVGGEMHEVMVNARHEQALRRARESSANAVQALAAGVSLELVALDLRVAVHALGEIVGKATTEDLLDSIFSQFCLGK